MELFHKDSETEFAEKTSSSCGEAYNNLLNECIKEVEGLNAELADEYGLGSYARWDIDQMKGELVFSEGGLPILVCSVTLLGSFSNSSESWMWGWANPSVLEPLSRDTKALRDYGDQHEIEDLIVGKTPATEEEAWALCALSCHILNGRGLYRGPTGKGFVVMMIKDINWSEQEAP